MNRLDKDYCNLLQDILDNGHTKSDRTGTGTLSVFGRQIRHKMSDGFPILTTKKVSFKNVVTELLWFLKGRTDLRYLLEHNCHIWDGDCYKRYCNHKDTVGPLTMEQFIEEIKTNDVFASKWGDLGPIYGKQWRKWNTTQGIALYGDGISIPYVLGWDIKKDATFDSIQIDQIKEALEKLKTNPDDRGIIVSAWNVGELNDMILRPCHNFFQFYTRELSLQERGFIAGSNHYEVSLNIKFFTKVDEDEQLHKQLDDINIPRRAISLMWNQRSVDTPLGLPYNIASYGLLLSIFAKLLNMVPDELIGNLGDTHIYSNQIEGVKEQLARTSFELPTIDIHPGILDYDFDKFEHGMLTLNNYQAHPAIKIPLSN